MKHKSYFYTITMKNKGKIQYNLSSIWEFESK